MSNTFLVSLCDFHYNYFGCSNKNILTMMDIILIVIQLTSLISPLLYYIVRKSTIDSLAILIVTCRALGAVFLFRLRQVLWLGPDDMLSYTRGNIFTEWILMTISGMNIIVGVAMNTFVAIMIHTISGSLLYDPLIINGKKVDPTVLLKVWRLTFAISVSCCYICFAVIGVTSYDNYVLWRRVALFPVGVVSFIISPGLLYLFGNNVIRVISPIQTSEVTESNAVTNIGHDKSVEAKERPIIVSVKLENIEPEKKSIRKIGNAGNLTLQKKITNLKRVIYYPMVIFILSGIIFFLMPL